MLLSHAILYLSLDIIRLTMRCSGLHQVHRSPQTSFAVHARGRSSLVCQAAATRVFQTANEAWVIAPTRGKPRGIVHFLGGAFAGAAPQVLYSLLLEQVAASGFTVIATPYAITFQHLDCARAVRRSFLEAVSSLQAGGADTAFLAPADVPLLGLGHSNGALMHLLIGTQEERPVASNVLISFNNKQVGDAIPIPGFLSTLTPTVQAVRSNPLPLPLPLPSASDFLRAAAALAPPMLQLDAQGQLSRAALALEQVGSVVNEVGDGTTDFTPSPEESRQLISRSYRVAPTLLLRYADDGIDESPEMERILRSSMSSGVSYSVIPGSHVTPCGGDVAWETGRVFAPADALALAAKAVLQADLRRTVRQITDWYGGVVAS